ncbi:hypothetical protein ACF05T_32235 [Streptomyces lateritius]|uniref:Uncharacterized protein n=1 Tax=Streptomyces lateritius TaxID=67313 RepID=A0ABW6YLE4_9ACTN
MGQTPAQKAAQVARGQQPKKRPGKTQREASPRAQAAKKKAGGGKPTAKKTAAKKTAAKKTVPPPRGSARAAYGGTCPACLRTRQGRGHQEGNRWLGTSRLRPRQLSTAEREFARIEAGETVRGQKPSDWRLGSSPSSTRPAR